MKKILLISNMYPSDKYPSYGVFVKNTENILLKNKYCIKKVVMNKYTNNVIKLIKYILFYIKIIYMTMFNKFDIIYVHYASHCSLPLLIAKAVNRDLKIYTNLHGSDVVPENNIQKKLQGYVSKLLKCSNKIIVPSSYFKKLVSEKYNIDNNKIFIFPSGGINKKRFYVLNDNTNSLKKFNLDNRYKYIGYVGRIDYKKGWEVFLSAFKLIVEENKLANVRAIVVGNGKEINKFNDFVKENELNEYIVHLDLLPQNQLVHIYNVIDVFCFPTMRKGESLGLVGLEAMACGVPVIGSELGGLMDYIKHGKNGYLFKKGDHKDLSKYILKYFTLDKYKKNMLKNEAINTSKHYEEEKIEKILLEIFDN